MSTHSSKVLDREGFAKFRSEMDKLMLVVLVLIVSVHYSASLRPAGENFA